MTKKVEPLPLRQSDDGKWEVKNPSGKWIKCYTEADAKIISNAPIVRAKLDEATLPDKALAAKLEKTAEIQNKYNMGTAARYFQKMAKRARGQK